MSKVWDRVVQDLESYIATEKKQKSFWQKLKNYLTSDACGGDCRQGRAPCNCGKRVNHDNRY